MLKKNSLMLYLLLNLACTLSAMEEKTLFIREIHRENELEALIERAQKPVVIDFWAPWCRACTAVKPAFEAVAKDLQKECIFISINIDKVPQLKDKYELQALPTFILIKDNATVGRYLGCLDRKRLKENILNTLNEKLNIHSLVAAIQEGNKEKIALCLKDKNISVNGVYQIETFGISLSMTPLIGAVAKTIFWDGSPDVVVMLVKANAKLCQEVDTPIFDKSYKVTEWKKQSALSLIEESAKEKSQKELLELSDPAREFVMKSQKNAKDLLKLLNKNGIR